MATAGVHEAVDAGSSDNSVPAGKVTPEGGYHAVDDLRDSVDFVALGAGDVIHAGGIHPYSLGHCTRGGADSSHSGAQAVVGLARRASKETPL